MAGKPDQMISPEQWAAIKGTVAALSAIEVSDPAPEELPGWFFDFRDHLRRLVVAATEPVEAFEFTEHFAYLLDMYVAGSSLQEEVADGSRLVIEWCQAALEASGALGISPKQDSTKSIWLVVHAFDEEGGS